MKSKITFFEKLISCKWHWLIKNSNLLKFIKKIPGMKKLSRKTGMQPGSLPVLAIHISGTQTFEKLIDLSSILIVP